MPDNNAAIVTLTTDFGDRDSYVAQMKGVLLGINPHALVVDVTHHIAPQNLRQAAYLIDGMVDAFPAGTLHVAVIDPGVGSSRAIVALEAGQQRFLGPDNGIFTLIQRRLTVSRVVTVTESRFWRTAVSHTFHGRDVMAAVAGHWSAGCDLQDFGDPVTAPLVELSLPEPIRQANTLRGEVIWIDAFGNLVTNIRAEQLPGEHAYEVTVDVQSQRVRGIRHYYAEAAIDEVLALIGSHGRLEIAVHAGNAAQRLAAGVGDAVHVKWGEGMESPP